MNVSHFKDLKEIKKIQSNIIFPFYITAGDYHDFKFIKDLLVELTGEEDIEYEELGCDVKYHAVFLKKGQKKNKVLKKEIKRLQDEFDGIFEE